MGADGRGSRGQQENGDSAALSTWTGLFFCMSLFGVVTHVSVRL